MRKSINRRWSYSENQQLIKLYLKQKISIKRICEILDRSPSAISSRLHVLEVERRNKSPKTTSFKITPALARIHAHICGDGYLTFYREKDGYGPWSIYRKNQYYRTRYLSCYTNMNQRLLQEFREDMLSVFGVKGKKVYRHTIRVASKRIWTILRNLGAGASREWYIPNAIFSSSRKVKLNWIRAFFDDEAYFGKGKRIRVKVVNKKGLKQIQGLLNEFIPSIINPKKGSYRGAYSLDISRKFTPEYFQKIGSLRFKK